MFIEFLRPSNEDPRCTLILNPNRFTGHAIVRGCMLHRVSTINPVGGVFVATAQALGWWPAVPRRRSYPTDYFSPQIGRISSLNLDIVASLLLPAQYAGVPAHRVCTLAPGSAALISNYVIEGEGGNMFESGRLSLVNVYAFKHIVRRLAPDSTTKPNRFSTDGMFSPSEHATLALAIGTVLAESVDPEY